MNTITTMKSKVAYFLCLLYVTIGLYPAITVVNTVSRFPEGAVSCIVAELIGAIAFWWGIRLVRLKRPATSFLGAVVVFLPCLMVQYLLRDFVGADVCISYVCGAMACLVLISKYLKR